jgi:hypothetical protein
MGSCEMTIRAYDLARVWIRFRDDVVLSASQSASGLYGAATVVSNDPRCETKYRLTHSRIQLTVPAVPRPQVPTYRSAPGSI